MLDIKVELLDIKSGKVLKTKDIDIEHLTKIKIKDNYLYADIKQLTIKVNSTGNFTSVAVKFKDRYYNKTKLKKNITVDDNLDEINLRGLKVEGLKLNDTLKDKITKKLI